MGVSIAGESGGTRAGDPTVETLISAATGARTTGRCNNSRRGSSTAAVAFPCVGAICAALVVGIGALDSRRGGGESIPATAATVDTLNAAPGVGIGTTAGRKAGSGHHSATIIAIAMAPIGAALVAEGGR